MHTFWIVAGSIGALYAAVGLYIAYLAACKHLAARAEAREMARLTATTKTTTGGQP